MQKNSISSAKLAARITKAASKQTFYTIRALVDRDLIPDAYRAYGYFRWVDDTLDQDGLPQAQRTAFVERQIALLDRCYGGESPGDVCAEERMLVDLIQDHPAVDNGLHAYLQDMMAVMLFDTQRRGRLISQRELDEYTLWLASAVTEALHYFIGQRCYSPVNDIRYRSATAAHIVHMLRDTFEDIATGYYNAPREFLEAHGLSPQDVGSDAYREWVRGRVRLAREHIEAGKDYLTQVENLRCRLAGYAYIARFEGVLDSIEGEGYRLRADYPERKGLAAGLKMAWLTLWGALRPHCCMGMPRTPRGQIEPSIGEP